jgi:hypothetical protein
MRSSFEPAFAHVAFRTRRGHPHTPSDVLRLRPVQLLRSLEASTVDFLEVAVAARCGPLVEVDAVEFLDGCSGHSITSSARASKVGGTSRPSALAVLRLMGQFALPFSSTQRRGEPPRRDDVRLPRRRHAVQWGGTTSSG